jgi:antitoxin YefM
MCLERTATADTSRLRRPCHERAMRSSLPSIAARPALTHPDFLVILLTMTVLPLGEVKSHLSELVGRVHDHHERVTVTVHGRPSAVLVALEDLERLEETLEILRDPETVKRLASSDAELARGESVSAEELAETMRRRRSK